jgi:hypothetical protein
MTMKRPMLDWVTRLSLIAIALLLAANLANSAATSTTRTAYGAGVPDTGAQFQAMVDELHALNGKVDSLQKLLESGNLQVKVVAKKDAE